MQMLEQKAWHELECAARSAGGIEVAMVSLPIEKVKALVAGHTLRAAPVEGLETTCFMATENLPGGSKRWQCVEHQHHANMIAYDSAHPTDVVPQVARPQAEAIIAAREAEYQQRAKGWRDAFDSMHRRAMDAEADNAAVTKERDALIEAGLKCCNGTPNPELPKFELALSFINSTNEARRAADIVWQDLKADNAALTARVKHFEDAIKAKGGNEHSPTQDAYDLACKAIEKHRDHAEALKTQLAAATDILRDWLKVGNKIGDRNEIRERARAALEVKP